MCAKRFSFFQWDREERPEIIEVRHRFFNQVVYPFLILGLLAAVMGGLQAFQQGRWIFTLLYGGSFLIFVATALPGFRISLAIRSLGLLLALLILSISVLCRIGLSGIALELLTLACAASSALLGKRAGLVLVSIGAVGILIVGWGMVTGVLPIREDQMLTSLSPLAWGTSLVVFVMVGVGVVTIPQNFLTRLKESLALLEKHAGQLERSNASLKETIKAREEAESAMRESEERFSELAERNFDMIFSTDTGGHVTYVSAASEKILGFRPEEMLGKHFLTYLAPSEIPRVTELFSQKLQGKDVKTVFMEVIKRDGTHGHIELNSSLVSKDGEVVGTQGVIRDVTEKMRLEKQLKRAQKMETFGLMAGGVAHDLNNILSGIVSYPDLFLMDLPEDSRFRRPLEIIKESGQRAAAVVADLLTVARGVASKKEVLNLQMRS